MDINHRFKFSLENTNIQYFNETEVFKENNSKYSSYIRVKISNSENIHFNKIGEIIEFNNNMNKYTIALSNNDVAGFNNQIDFQHILFDENDFHCLDSGLNSPYIFDYQDLINKL